VTLSAPPASEGLTLRFQEPGKRTRDVRLEPGRPQTVNFEVCSRGAWYVTYLSSARGFVGTRVVSAQASEARVSPLACSAVTEHAPPALPTEQV
jgi:hypothetical protein